MCIKSREVKSNHKWSLETFVEKHDANRCTVLSAVHSDWILTNTC